MYEKIIIINKIVFFKYLNIVFFSIQKVNVPLKGKKIFYSVFLERQMYGPMGSRTLPWAKCQIVLKALFICYNTNTNLNKNFHTQLSYRSFKPLFLFFHISARSSLKKFENEKWPKAGYLPLCIKSVRVKKNFVFLIWNEEKQKARIIER